MKFLKLQKNVSGRKRNKLSANGYQQDRDYNKLSQKWSMTFLEAWSFSSRAECFLDSIVYIFTFVYFYTYFLKYKLCIKHSVCRGSYPEQVSNSKGTHYFRKNPFFLAYCATTDKF